MITVGTLVVILTAGLPPGHAFFKCKTEGRAMDVSEWPDGEPVTYRVEFECVDGPKSFWIESKYVLNAEALK